MKVLDSVTKHSCNLQFHRGKACFNRRILHDSSPEAPCQRYIPSMKTIINLRDTDGTAFTLPECLAFILYMLPRSLSLQARKGLISIF